MWGVCKQNKVCVLRLGLGSREQARLVLAVSLRPQAVASGASPVSNRYALLNYEQRCILMYEYKWG